MKNVARWLLPVSLLCSLSVSTAQADSCPGDVNGDGEVTVDELVRAVNHALNGCPPALALGGPYDGDAVAIRSQCADPADNGTFSLPAATVQFDEQEGNLFSGMITGTDDEGNAVAINIAGSVDAEAVLRGSVWDDEGEITGTIRGNIAGDGLALAASVFETERSCQVATTFLAKRRQAAPGNG